MLGEAKDFATQLKKCEAAIRLMKNACEVGAAAAPRVRFLPTAPAPPPLTHAPPLCSPAPLAQEMLKTVKSSMLVPLPHVYEETAAASGGAVRPSEAIGGPGFAAESISAVRPCSARRAHRPPVDDALHLPSCASLRPPG